MLETSGDASLRDVEALSADSISAGSRVMKVED
jgi:hypothetical protein